MKKLIIAFGLCLILGCQAELIVDPNTGEETKTYVLDTEKADQVEAVAETAVGVGTLTSTYLPWLAPFVGLGAGALATWKKIRPKLEQATTARDSYYLGGTVLAEALEEIKTNQPDLWEKVGPVISKATGPVSKAEDAIRGFRHLPPKS